MENASFKRLFIGFFNELNKPKGNVEGTYRCFQQYAIPQTEEEIKQVEVIKKVYEQWKQGDFPYEVEDTMPRM